VDQQASAEESQGEVNAEKSAVPAKSARKSSNQTLGFATAKDRNILPMTSVVTTKKQPASSSKRTAVAASIDRMSRAKNSDAINK
jgi:hypothetical protein